MGAKNIGNKYSLGKKLSPEAISKIKAKRALQPPTHTTPHTKETKDKISNTLKEKHLCPPNAKKVEDISTGIIYRSINECCSKLSITKKVLCNRLKTGKEWNGHIFKFIK